MPGSTRELSARIEPFDSYWQAPKDVEKGYSSFKTYYRYNILPRLPKERDARILVVSAGPGYLVSLLKDEGYTDVLGIDSDPEKVKFAQDRSLPVEVATAFEYLESHAGGFDVIVGEQELNHLTKAEMIEFLVLARDSLRPGGLLLVYGLNGANPITGAETLAQNIDHFHTFTAYSLTQALELAGLHDISVFPLKLYVFYRNPLNYVGLAVTSCFHFLFRALFALYGKKNAIWTKKIAATARRAHS